MNIRILYIITVALLFAFGCSKSPQSDKLHGKVALSLMVDDSTNAVTKSDAPEFRIYILNADKDTLHTYEDLATMPSSIELRVGTYTAIAESKNFNSQAGFEKMSYHGQKEFSVLYGELTPVEIEASISNILVDVTYTDRFKSLITDYDITLTSDMSEELMISKDETRTAYINIVNTLTYSLRVKNDKGIDVTFVREITDLKPADHLKLKFDLAEPDDEQSTGAIRLTIDMTLNETQHSIEMLVNPGDKPLIEAVDFDVNQDIVVSDDQQAAATVSIKASNPVYGIYINSSSSFLQDLGFPALTNLLTLTADQKTTLADVGLVITDPTTGLYPERSPRNAQIDFSEFAKRLSDGRHYFEVSVLDVNYLSTKLSFNFDVSGAAFRILSANSYDIYRSETNSAKVVLVGSYTSSSAPAGLTFQYKTAEDGNWNSVPHSDITIDNQRKEFTAITFIPENSSVTLRAATVVDQSVNYGAGELKLTTTPIPRISGLSFEDWTQSGKTWYPNSSASNNWWATGNEGLTGSPVNQSSNTTPEDVIVIKGRAARLESHSISFFLSPIKFAAGNLFLGTYKTNISDPIKSVTLGRPFTGRPDQLKGYYYYKPADYNGGKDYCHIYISLENRSNGTTVVGYGELKSNRTDMTGYESFTIDVNYSSDLPVTDVIIIATSSVDGANFKGGVGSLLYVDEFEIVYNGN